MERHIQGVTSGTITAYHSGALESPSVFNGVPVAESFYVVCCRLLFAPLFFFAI